MFRPNIKSYITTRKGVQSTENPSYWIYTKKVYNNLKHLRKYTDNILLSVKSIPMVIDLLHSDLIRDLGIDSFNISNFNEAKRVKHFNISCKTISIFSPELSGTDLIELETFCYSFAEEVHIVFDSMEQYYEYKGHENNPCTKLLFRIDTSVIEHTSSKFGVSLSELSSIISELDGLHYHSTTDSIEPYQVFLEICSMYDLEIINLGGGQHRHKFTSFLKSNHYIEPGQYLFKDAINLVGKVKHVKAVDSYIQNHMHLITDISNLLHLQWSTKDHIKIGFSGSQEGFEIHTFDIHGPTCFNNDVIGHIMTKGFMPKKDDLIIIKGVSVYSIIHSHSFNGISIPPVYCV